MRAVRRPRSVVALLVFAALLAAPMVMSLAAAGAAVPERAVAQSSDGSSSEVLATLTISTDNVSVRKDGKKKFKAAKDGQSLKEGDTIQTDETGTAEIDYGNDAFTRLDVNTTFTIVVLTDEQGARQVQGSLETGQTWNRTAALTESGSFEQEGAGANATVRGTAFAIECDTVDHCVFTAVVDDIDLTGLDGVTQLLTPLDQCDSTDTTNQGELTGVLCGDITQISPDDLPQWILQNLLQDLILGLPDGGILTGTVVVTSTGAVVFVPGPAPSSGGGTTPVTSPAPPQFDAKPVLVESCDNAPPDDGCGVEGGATSSVSAATAAYDIPASGLYTTDGAPVSFQFNVSTGPSLLDFLVYFASVPDVEFGVFHLDGPGGDVVVIGNGYAPTQVFTFAPTPVDEGEGGIDASGAPPAEPNTQTKVYAQTASSPSSRTDDVTIPITNQETCDCECGGGGVDE